MSVEAEDTINEIEIWLDRTKSAVEEVSGMEANYRKGVLDGLNMVMGAVRTMREEL